MSTNDRLAVAADQGRTDIRSRLSALWMALMLIYIYADILGFYTPGVIDGVRTGTIGAVSITSGFLLIMAIWMAVPGVMIYLSLTLPCRINRVTNIVVGIVSLVMLVATFFAGDLSVRYAFQALLEAAFIVVIVRSAWKWVVTRP